MRKLSVFNHESLDGYFVDARGDMSWAKGHQDAEWNEFVASNASGGGVLVFGRITYELMAGFWPTPVAMEMMPEVAKGMNSMPKVVFSKTLEEVSWNNTSLLKCDLAAEIRKMKAEPGDNLLIMGSGTIVSQLTEERLIDEYMVVVNPVVLGQGRTMFEGIKEKVELKCTSTRAFGNGNVFVCYEPIKG